MKTAKDFLIEKGYTGFANKTDVPLWMVEFAKLHVDAALKSACENAWAKHYRDSDGCEYDVDEDSILSAYPLENIK